MSTAAFTTSVTLSAATSSAMIGSTMRSKIDCDNLLAEFESEGSTEQERKEYSYCVEREQSEKPPQLTHIEMLGISLIPIALMAVILAAAIAVFERRVR